MSSAQSAAEFLKELPSFNENNFTRFQADSASKPTGKRPSIYISTKDYPDEQIITTEKTNILLRYLNQHTEKKSSTKKQGKHSSSNVDEESSRKRLRTLPS